MFHWYNKEHEAITAEAVKLLAARYPNLLIREQGSMDGMYFIYIGFPSLPREQMLVFEGKSAQGIVADVDARISLLCEAAKKMVRDTQMMMADCESAGLAPCAPVTTPI